MRRLALVLVGLVVGVCAYVMLRGRETPARSESSTAVRREQRKAGHRFLTPAAGKESNVRVHVSSAGADLPGARVRLYLRADGEWQGIAEGIANGGASRL